MIRINFLVEILRKEGDSEESVNHGRERCVLVSRIVVCGGKNHDVRVGGPTEDFEWVMLIKDGD